MAESEYLRCRHDENHVNVVSHGVLCADCQRPLFKVRWWYHVILLNFAFLAIGLVLGGYHNLWIATLMTEVLLVVYLLVLFRWVRSSFYGALAAFIFLLPIVFVNEFGNLGYSKLEIVRTICLYAISAALLLAYFLSWLDEINEREINLLKTLSALSLGWFVIIVSVQKVDERLHFIDPQTALLINRQIHIREILLAISIIHILVYGVWRSIQTKIEVRRVFFKDRTLAYVTRKPPTNFFSGIVEGFIIPAVNIALAFYKGIVDILKPTANFIIHLALIVTLRIANFCWEVLLLIKDMLVLFCSALWNFLRKMALPTLLLGFAMWMVAAATGIIHNHINGTATAENYGRAGLILLGLNAVILLIGWLWGDDDPFAASCGSVIRTNVTLLLLFTAYAVVASLELWLMAQWLAELPFRTIGVFTIYSLVGLTFFIVLTFLLRKTR